MTGSTFWDAVWIFALGGILLGLVFLFGAWVREMVWETRRYEDLRERQRKRHLRPWEQDVPSWTGKQWRDDP